MGLETEKADVQLFMADDAYSHHSGVDYADPEKYIDSSHDRDPHQLNSHLKVSFRLDCHLGWRLLWVPGVLQDGGRGCPFNFSPAVVTGPIGTGSCSYRHQAACAARNRVPISVCPLSLHVFPSDLPPPPPSNTYTFTP